MADGAVIDCNGSPAIPKGWTLSPEDQLQGALRGLVLFNPHQCELILDDAQKSENFAIGTRLLKVFAVFKLYRACVLDYLLANTHLIPEDWKQDGQGNTLYIFFWGDIYRDSDFSRCIRCLYWDGHRWCSEWRWLDFGFYSNEPALISR